MKWNEIKSFLQEHPSDVTKMSTDLYFKTNLTFHFLMTSKRTTDLSSGAFMAWMNLSSSDIFGNRSRYKLQVSSNSNNRAERCFRDWNNCKSK